jgi:sigma-B regulation protein RsbU (phosphoserine phosphatase)
MNLRRFLFALCMIAVASPAVAQLPAQDDVVILNTWRIHAGDDLNWAKPDFDDSGWKPGESPTKNTGLVFDPGFLWYRTTVSLPTSLQGRDLAIGMGPFDEVYEVYVEGVSVGRLGHWTPRPESPFDRNLTFPIPPGLIKGQMVHLAIRRWRGAASTSLFPYYSFGAARFSRAPEIGLLSTVIDRTKLSIDSGIVRNLPWNLSLLLMLGAGCVAFVLYSAQRNRVEYLLLGIFCAGQFIDPLAGGLLAASDSVMRRSWPPVLVFALLVLFSATQVLFLAHLCPLLRRWLEAGAGVQLLFGLSAVFAMATQATFTNATFYSVSTAVPVILILLAAIGLLLERKAGSVAIAIALLIGQLTNAWVNNISHFLGVSDLRFMPLGPVSVDIRAISQVLFVFVTLSVLYLRFREEQLRQVSLEQEMASARRMQEQLLGGNLSRVAGFDLAAVYRPATEVGGDFYLAVSLEDGSLLVVVGDVSGKGLDAAMLVASVLGSLTNEVERSPAPLLEYLNRAVAGKTGGGFITACCARFYPGLRVVIANAGHISPYLDGREVPLENGLPLGVSPCATYSETEIQTAGTVTFLSDGVVEARDAKGELLGFDRMAVLTTKPAAEIADAAQRWGQEDDITVLTVARSPLTC